MRHRHDHLRPVVIAGWVAGAQQFQTAGRAPTMYSSTFPSSPATDQYLRAGKMIGPDETGQDMVNRVVAALATADAHFDPDGADAFAERLGRAWTPPGSCSPPRS